MMGGPIVGSKRIYLIGSLRNPRIPEIGNALRDDGLEVFDDWWAGGPEADDWWQTYERMRGRDLRTAIQGEAARHVFEFDLKWLNWANTGVLVLPAGKSGHLELGYLIGQGKDAWVLMEDGDPERYDVMYRFAQGVVFSVNELRKRLNENK